MGCKEEPVFTGKPHYPPRLHSAVAWPRAPAARATAGLGRNCSFVAILVQRFDVLRDTFNPRAYHAKRTHPPSYFGSIIEICRIRHNYFNYFSLVFETHSRVTN